MLVLIFKQRNSLLGTCWTNNLYYSEFCSRALLAHRNTKEGLPQLHSSTLKNRFALWPLGQFPFRPLHDWCWLQKHLDYRTSITRLYAILQEIGWLNSCTSRWRGWGKHTTFSCQFWDAFNWWGLSFLPHPHSKVQKMAFLNADSGICSVKDLDFCRLSQFKTLLLNLKARVLVME